MAEAPSRAGGPAALGYGRASPGGRPPDGQEKNGNTALAHEPRARAEVELLNEITTAAAGEAELDAILSSALERLSRFVAFSGGSIALVEEDVLVVAAAVGPLAEAALRQRIPRNDGISWRVLETRQPFVSEDVQGDGLRGPEVGSGNTIRSYLAVPLVFRNEAIGILQVDSTVPGSLRSDDIALLEAVAVALSGPIELARRFRAEARALAESERAQDRLGFLAEASRLLASSLDYPATLTTLARLTIPRLADWCSVAVADDTGQLRPIALVRSGRRRESQRDVREASDVAAELRARLAAGEPVVLPRDSSPHAGDGAAAEDEVGRRFLAAHGLDAALLVPLLIRGGFAGSIALGSSGSGRRYGPDDVALAEELALRAASAVDNARLYQAEHSARHTAERAADRTARLQAITAALSEALTPEDVMDVVVHQAVDSTAAAAGSIAILTPTGDLEIGRSLGYEAELLARFRRFPVTAELPLALSVRTGQPVLLRNGEERLARFPELAELRATTGHAAIAAVPLTVEGRTVGALGLSFTEQREFDEEDREFLLALARQGAQALERARAYEAERAARSEKAESLALLDTLLETAPVGMAFWDRALRYVRVNDALGAMNGLEPEAHLGRTPREVVPGLADQLEHDLRSVIETAQPLLNRELSGVTPASPDAVRHWLASYYPVRIGSSDVLGAGTIVYDVTARRRAEEERSELLRELGRFKTTLDATLDGVFLFDPDTLRYFYVNQGASDGAAYSREQLLALGPVDLLPEYDEARFRDLIRPLLEGKVSSTTITSVHRRGDGSTFPAEIFLQYIGPAGEPGRLIAIVRDVSDRVEARERLQQLAQSERALNAELKAIIRAMGEGVMVFDASGRVIFANPAAESLFPGAISRYGQLLERLDDPHGLAPRLRQPIVEGPVELGLKGDPECWVELTTYPVFTPAESYGDGEEHVLETILFARDVTELRRVRSARDAFIGVLSHELRTPVTTIYGNAKILARPQSHLDEAGRHEIYADIETESERLHRLVEDLLVLARYGEGQGREAETEPLLLQRILPPAIRAEQGRWPESRFEVAMPPSLPAVEGDQTYLDQVVRNLLSNAAKYGTNGAPIEVVIDARDDEEVRVQVLDRGPGFSPDEAERLFELFYRSPNMVAKASGAGIGLFVCKRLMEAMGGRIWARPREGGGAEFGFALRWFNEESA